MGAKEIRFTIRKVANEDKPFNRNILYINNENNVAIKYKKTNDKTNDKCIQ